MKCPTCGKKMLQHGTTTMYTREKCRCEKCKKAWNKYARDLRAKKKIK